MFADTLVFYYYRNFPSLCFALFVFYIFYTWNVISLAKTCVAWKKRACSFGKMNQTWQTKNIIQRITESDFWNERCSHLHCQTYQCSSSLWIVFFLFLFIELFFKTWRMWVLRFYNWNWLVTCVLHLKFMNNLF